MARGKSRIDKLDKSVRDRHFPDGGKGSHARKSTTATREAFKDNYDKIDWTYTGKSYIKCK